MALNPRDLDAERSFPGNYAPRYDALPGFNPFGSLGGS